MKILLSLCLLISILCAESMGQNMGDKKRIVFPADKNLERYPYSTLAARFTPSDCEIDIADAYLRQFFLDRYSGKKETSSLEDYHRQYIGHTINNQKFIIILGSCNELPTLNEQAIMVLGGGKCYFDSEINLSKNEIHFFQFNGPK